MSFAITLAVDTDGAATIITVQGKPVPGTYTINGHAHNPDAEHDWESNSIGVVAPFAVATASAAAKPVT